MTSEQSNLKPMRPYIIPTKLIGRKWKGFALFPFIFTLPQYKDDNVFINHEMIHLRQQWELWFIGFWILYLYYLLIRGYRNNPFELEAYHNQDNLMYLVSRKPFNYRKYI